MRCAECDCVHGGADCNWIAPPTGLKRLAEAMQGINDIPDPYETLNQILDEAFEQASGGKGKDRHARDGQAFEDQQICTLARTFGLGFPLGQAAKKMDEAQRLDTDAAVAELLGAINYLAAAIIVIREE